LKTTIAYKERFVATPIECEEWMHKVFGKDPFIILDIGACDGLSSIRYGKQFPSAIVVGFEPIYENWFDSQLNAEVFDADTVTFYNTALSDKTGMATFFKSMGQAPGVTDSETGNKSSSLFAPKEHLNVHKWCKFEKHTVFTIRFDEWREQHVFDDSLPVFIHIDVQGAELKVFDGFGKHFAQVKAVWMEVSNVPLYDGQPLKQDVEKYMGARGFRKFIDTCNRTAGDQLWIREECHG
jgi:FkbM family methyltransferase